MLQKKKDKVRQHLIDIFQIKRTQNSHQNIFKKLIKIIEKVTRNVFINLLPIGYWWLPNCFHWQSESLVLLFSQCIYHILSRLFPSFYFIYFFQKHINEIFFCIWKRCMVNNHKLFATDLSIRVLFESLIHYVFSMPCWLLFLIKQSDIAMPYGTHCYIDNRIQRTNTSKHISMKRYT